MTDDAELLNFIYQNSEMGANSISQLLDIVEDEQIKEHLERQLRGYNDINRKAKELLNKNGFDEKGIGSFEKLKAYMMINIKTLKDKSPTNIAEMMITGSNMGITDAIKRQHEYKSAEKNIISLMERLQHFEENNVERLKEFL